MPEEIKEAMKRMSEVLPTMDDVSLARLTGYAEGYADRAGLKPNEDQPSTESRS